MQRPLVTFLCFLSLHFLTTCEETLEQPEEPQPTTLAVTAITEHGATFNGTLLAGTKVSVWDHGFIWSLQRNQLTIDQSEQIRLGPVAKSGPFTAKITFDLEPNKTYYVRSFVLGKKGSIDVIVYGNEVSFESLGAEAPVIADFQPRTADLGDTLVITGANFSSNAAKNNVQIGILPLDVIQATPTQLKAVVPDYLESPTGRLSVTVYGNIAYASPDFELNGPSISYFSPEEGNYGSYIEVVGKNFIPGHTTLFFGTDSVQIYNMSATHLYATLNVSIPGGANEVKVKVFNKTATAARTFNNLSPYIEDFNPKEVTFGDEVTIKGTNLSGGSYMYVYIQGSYCELVSTDEDEITVKVPNDLNVSEGAITVTTSYGSATSKALMKLKAPIVTSYTPKSGSIGTHVTLRGRYFSPSWFVNQVHFDGQAAQVISTTQDEIVVSVPSSADELSQIVITVAGQSVDVGTFEIFPPVITDYSPKKGSTGTEITIKGENFSDDLYQNQVTVGGFYCTPLSVSDTELKVRIDADVTQSSGSLELTVGNMTVTAGETFTFVWVRKNDFVNNRSGSVSFVYDGKGYVGFGYDPWGGKDLWEYNQVTDSWSQKASMPSETIRAYAPRFILDDELFTGSGAAYSTYLRDFWKYNFSSNSWSRIADLPEEKILASSFSANGKGYIGLGSSNGYNPSKTFYEYDPAANTWSSLDDFPGEARMGPVTLSVDGAIIVGLGDYYGSFFKDLYKFNPVTKTWTKLKDFPGEGRSRAMTFTINETVYIAGGYNNTGYLSEVWAYDIARDSWEQKSNFGGGGRIHGAAFGIGNKGYLGTGGGPGYDRSDLWEYDPSLDE